MYGGGGVSRKPGTSIIEAESHKSARDRARRVRAAVPACEDMAEYGFQEVWVQFLDATIRPDPALRLKIAREERSEDGAG